MYEEVRNMKSVNKVILLGNLTRTWNSGTLRTKSLCAPLGWQPTEAGYPAMEKNTMKQTFTFP
jgi:hypothetical protein